MKIHKNNVLIESQSGYLEVIAFYDTTIKLYGADIYYQGHLTETISSMENEPQREHLLSIGYHFLFNQEKKQAG